jgi:hypothetical protein
MKNFTLKKYLYCMLLLIFGSITQSKAQYITREITGSSFEVPSGVTEITIEAWGGGGKGGNRTNNGASGGGGGGAYSRSKVTVTPGQILEITIGQGSTNSSNTGGDTSVKYLTTNLVLAKGGNSVADNSNTGANGGSSANGIAINGIKYSGGKGANSTTNTGGGGGSSAGSLANGVNGSSSNGGIAPSNGGNGGNGGTNTANGSTGAIPGGGGGGCSKGNNGQGNPGYGGNGGNGKLLITYKKRIEVSGNNTIILNGNTTASTSDDTFFGEAGILNSITKTFTIKNAYSSGTLTVGSVVINGVNSSEFTISSQPSTLIGPNESTTFTVTFTPTSLGLKNARVRFSNNDPHDNPFEFSIQGQGTFAMGPGGIRNENLQLWLRSDMVNGTTSLPTDGSNVSTWKTLARGSDAIKPTKVRAPKFRNNTTYNINFNSVIDFTNNFNSQSSVYHDNDTTREYLKGTNGFYSQEMFVVMIPDVTITNSTPNMDLFCGDRNANSQEEDVTGIGLGSYSTRFNNEILSYCIGNNARYGVAQTVNSTYSITNAGIINTSQNVTNRGVNLLYNGVNVGETTVNASTFENISDSKYWIGRSEAWNGSFDGRIGEIITFSNRLTDNERSNVQSYLALKYGITLGTNGIATKYTNSSGSEIWNNTTNVGFNYNIAGIGRDDDSGLHQKQSKSSNNDALITIGLSDIFNTNSHNINTFSTDKSFLIWGSNGLNLNKSNQQITIDLGPSTVTTVTEIINRKWKIQETGGDVSTVKLSIPTSLFSSGFPTIDTNDAYVMIVASDANFTTNIEMIFMSSLGLNQICNYDFDDTKYFTFGVAKRVEQNSHITLDGINDYIKVGNFNNVNTAFTIMSWIRLDGNNVLNDERTIISKQNETEGYRLLIQTDNKIRIEWLKDGEYFNSVSNTVIPNGIWQNIAVTLSGGSVKIYINGTLDKTEILGSAPTANNSIFAIGGKFITKNNITHLFKGDIDEVRIWNLALNQTHIKYILNQEIEFVSPNNIKGKFISQAITKNDISTLAWSRLIAYYSMNSYIGTHLDDDSSFKNRGSMTIPDKIRIQNQTAPLPYQTQNDGEWSDIATWKNGNIQNLPYSLSIVDGKEITWNIVQTAHNVNSTGNKTLLALDIQNNSLNVSNDSKLEITHYLNLNGKIDLQGRSQLIQSINSDIDAQSNGFIERDQQGQSNKFNYNYWCSPVGAINNVSNNNNYTVNGVLRDGSDPNNPRNITWTTSLNGSPTSPITLSSYWIFKFQNLTPIYANWAAIGQNGTLSSGQGFTLKGSGATTSTQNLTFIGKPNNGAIKLDISPNNMNLTGNPYPSAIDATKFINDNINTTTGSIYYWEHFSTNNTHNLAGYQGGYAVRNLTGGTAPVSPAGISGLGSSNRTPKRYIPVGQGFYVIGSETGGEIKFNNDQRIFIKEDNTASNIMFRNSNNTDHFNYNGEDTIEEIENMKIRLGFNSYNGFHRELLLGFMEGNATENIDPGYDAIHLDDQQNDMYFLHDDTKLTIQGEGRFNINKSYPLGVKTHAAGTIEIRIDELENFDENQSIFIYDKSTDTYHDIRNSMLSIHLPQGIINDRFELRFINHRLNNDHFDMLNNKVTVSFTNNNNSIIIDNYSTDIKVEHILLYNILGQNIASWNVENEFQNNIQIPVKNVSTGTYIVRAETNVGTISKKIIIK